VAQYVEGQGAKGRGCFFYGCITCLAIVVVIVIGLGGVGYFGFKGQASARDAAGAFLDACEAGDYAPAYDMVSAAWRERTTAEEFAEAERAAAASRGSCDQRGTVGLRMSMEGDAGSRALIDFNAVCGGAETRITVTTVKEDGQWRVDGVDYRSRTQVMPQGCPNCGAVSPPGTNFCPRCGQRLIPAESPQTPTEADPADARRP
jgi:hypothetical protein